MTERRRDLRAVETEVQRRVLLKCAADPDLSKRAGRGQVLHEDPALYADYRRAAAEYAGTSVDRPSLRSVVNNAIKKAATPREGETLGDAITRVLKENPDMRAVYAACAYPESKLSPIDGLNAYSDRFEPGERYEVRKAFKRVGVVPPVVVHTT